MGVFDIDFFKSQGKFYFCELNLRFGGSGYAFSKMGVNLPEMMIRHFLGESIKDMNKVVLGSCLYFNERMAIDDWDFGYLSLKDLLKYRKESEIRFVEDDEDKRPQRVLNKEFRSKVIRKEIKRWIGRK